MSDMDLEHSGLQEVANAMRGDNVTDGPGQKRKRDSESADDTRRKRVSPTGNKDQQDSGVEALQDYNSLHQVTLITINGSASMLRPLLLRWPVSTLP